MSLGGDPSHQSSGRTGTFGPIETVDSPERVKLDLEIAGPMSRAFAYSIDYSLILLLMLGALLLFVSGSQQIVEWFSEFGFVQDLFDRATEWIGDADSDETSSMLRALALTLGIFMMLDLALTTFYFMFFETVFQGRTPGKRLTHLRVISEDGGILDWRHSLIRNLLRIVDALPAGQLVGVTAMLISPRVQRLGDLVAGTIVIRERNDFTGDVVSDAVIAPEIEAGFRFTRDEVAQIGEVERRLIRRTLRRAESLSERAARPIMDRATRAIAARIGRRDPISAGQRRDFLLALLQASERLV
jgi:uncharacterized RDD family membrane protein YckC